MIERKNSAKNEEKWTVHCDSCGAVTPQRDQETAGDAADHARLAGFTTRFQNVMASSTWHCPVCSLPKGKA